MATRQTRARSAPPPDAHTKDALARLGEALARANRPRPEAGALQALIAGIAACPPSRDHAWMDLVAVPPRPPEVVDALQQARAALAPARPRADGPEQGPRLRKLRAVLDAQKTTGMLIPRADAHQGEFVAGNAERLAWLTGFTGSAGFAVVLADRAALFVDGRYTLQAAEQVDTALWEIIPTAQTSVGDWLAKALTSGDRIGYDPWLHTAGEVERRARVCERVGASLVPLALNPIDSIWSDRPPPPLGPLTPQPEALAGWSSAEKRARIATDLRQQTCAATVITDPAALAWLLNIRGADVPFTPLALGFAILHDTGRVDLFMDSRKITRATHAHLGADVSVRPPAALGEALDTLGAQKRRVLIDREGCAEWIRDRLKRAGGKVLLGADPIALPKARKTPAELEGARAAHVRDGAALARFLCWLDREGPTGTQTEMSAAAQLETFRAEVAHYRGPSFETISGAGSNGAIVHYRVTPETDRALAPDMLYLVDSGGQFRDGTTDVTRTVVIGQPTAEQIRRFTLVLKGHIAIATVVFPRGTTGAHLDTLARVALWADGVDFEHGTGHGVGSHLGVHEGPQRISRRPSDVALDPGMIVSNEPGYYKAGSYGIRIENLVVVAQPRPPTPGAEIALLGFDTLTMAPIDRRLIDTGRLTDAERAWVDAYHARVRAEIGPLLDEDTRAWLDAATAPLEAGAARA
ncbi:aminopeptidase P family protein [Roseospira marina]|uniref:Aminopeptidase P family protein n=1 Tax=Roseospira marina TaxID=140057 RepID=A0A5M6IDG8_9PROT|nr:aminopeptidase P family protein [Roseospira marina]KAA5605775.1 aminopeptidase P family protein [Roseospira marina]MBB4313584.1 Xaa-Pro aminopeptidase [Roseospira marina]MBB5086746.1 Xaa-Pro aminopeptidase [Roseospira marina]